MINQPPKQKGFFAKNWGLLLAGGLVIGLILLAGLGVGAYLLLRTNVQATSINLSMEKPEFGKPLTAKVEVENKGILKADYHAVLLVDNEEAAADDVALESKEKQALTFDLKGLPAGKHTIKISGKEKEFTVYLPAELKVAKIAVDADPIKMGEPTKVKVTVKNSGELPGEFSSPLTLDGAELVKVKGTVEPGEETVLEAEFKPEERGSHTLAVEGTSLSVDVLAPAQIEVTGLTLSNEYPRPNEAITATVTVRNSGDLSGKYTVVLSVNGAGDQQQEVTVEPGSTRTVQFTVSQARAGSYTVKSGDMSKSMRVVVITRPKNGTFLISAARATTTNTRLGYMQIYNQYSKYDLMFVLARRDNPKVAVLAVFVRAGQNMQRFFVKNTSDYYAYYTIGGNFDSISRRFMANPKYYVCTENIDFDGSWYHFYLPNDKYFNTINESDFPD